MNVRFLQSRIYSRAATKDYRGYLLKVTQSCVPCLWKGRNVAVGGGGTGQHPHWVCVSRPICVNLFRGCCGIGRGGFLSKSKSNVAMRCAYVLALWQFAVSQRRSTRSGSAIRVSTSATNFNGGEIACLTNSLQRMIAQLSFRQFQPRSQWNMFHEGCA